MGRCFSTAYRIVMVLTSISALVLTCLSGTSCNFVTFDHQYKGEGRYLLESAADGEAGDALRRTLQTTPGIAPGDGIPAQAEEVAEQQQAAAELAAQTAAAAELAEQQVDPSSEGAPAGAYPGDGVLGDAAAQAAAMTQSLAEQAAAAGETAPTDASTEGGAEPSDASAADAALEETEAALEDQQQALIEAQTPEEAAANLSPSSPADDPAGSVTVAEPAPGEDAAIVATEEGSTTPQDEGAGSTTPQDEGVGSSYPQDEGSFGSPEPSEQEGGAYGSSAQAGEGSTAGTSSDVAASSEVVATASGEAGLFCSGEQQFSVTNLWGGSIQELENEINMESDANQSEEIARNALLAAAVIGSVVTFILVAESVIGWRMCLERWFVGLISAAACLSQGLTFLFFNSERYCDGDIVHEILNQEPCVVGQGGLFSAISIALYFVMIVMACRLPSDDPYGLCCKKKDSAQAGGSSSGNGFGLLGSKGAGSGSSSGKTSERPWVTSTEDKENEII
ncbi:hypothetical protein ACHAWF_010211 [Thalassiosira exigua]